MTQTQIHALYEYSKKVNDEKLTKNEALEFLSGIGLNRATASFALDNYKYMISGKSFTRIMNSASIRYFLDHIYKDHGISILENSLRSLSMHIAYIEGIRGKYNSHAVILEEYTQRYNIVSLRSVIQRSDVLPKSISSSTIALNENSNPKKNSVDSEQFINLQVDKILTNCDLFSFPQNNSYIQSYPEFITYFKSIEKIEKHHLVISSHFIYGWMPTILKLNFSEIGKVLDILNSVKNNKEEVLIKKENLEYLKRTINNSVVGVSKLLHFINPETYAIWDSRIYSYVSGCDNKQNQINNVNNYLHYLSRMNELKQDVQLQSFILRIQKESDYSISKIRALELFMFETVRSK